MTLAPINSRNYPIRAASLDLATAFFMQLRESMHLSGPASVEAQALA